ILALEALDLPPQLAVSPRFLPVELRRWVVVDEIRKAARRPSGKVRRRDPGSDFEAPRGDVEERLAALWEEVLGFSPVGRGDDFFELGGHSLLATQLLSRLRDAFGLELELSDVFEKPTVAGLAERLDQDAGPLQRPPLAPVDRSRPMRLSFAQERMWLLYRFDPEGIAYNLPAAIRLRGRLDTEALRKAYGEVARRHEILRTRFLEVGGVPQQEVLPSAGYRLPWLDLQGLAPEDQEAQVGLLGRSAGHRPFRLEKGEVYRNLLLILGEEDHAFVSACHHMVTDGWSGSLSIGEIATLYPAFADGLSSPLPEPELQYGDYAEWQRSWLQDDVLEELTEAWRQRLSPPPPVLELPLDRPRRSGTAAAGRCELKIGARTVEALRRLARETDSTLFMVSATLVKTFLFRYTGARDLALGTPVANRHVPGTERLLGVFINTLVLRSRPAGDLPFRDYLDQVREVSLEALRHQDMPFDKLVEALKPGRDAAGQTFFRVLLAFNHEPPPAPSLPGLDLEVVDLGERDDEAMFDLSLGLTDEGDGLSGSVQYNRTLLDPTTVWRWMGNLERLFEAAAADPGRPLDQLSLLGVAELHQVTFEGAYLAEGQRQQLVEAHGQAVAGETHRRFVAVDEARSPRPLGVPGRLAILREGAASV
ncbi:MAG: non-ribosomal peptide synthetase, partial [Acidobacteria bacterium]|nr:non-ribosomal peptide synthetase [Acidobacteriota bacterium]